MKCDVEHSYDTLNQSKVIELVDMLVREKSYLVRHFTQVRQRDKEQFAYLKCQECMTATCFTQIQKSVEARRDSSIFIDEMQIFKESGESIKEAIRNHVTENIIKCGKRLYRQGKGIAQGSAISVLLCSLAYASLESHILKKRKEGEGMPKTLLMHFVDDFLLVTTDIDVATFFVERTHRGLPEYGCWMNPAKTQLTFPLKEFCGNPPSDQVSWCGKLVTKDLNFMSDYSRYYNKSKKKLQSPFLFLLFTLMT